MAPGRTVRAVTVWLCKSRLGKPSRGTFWSVNGDPDRGAAWRRSAAFVIGALILLFELEWRSETRWGVVALAAVLMGIVGVDQLLAWGLVKIPHLGHKEEKPPSPT